MQTGRRQAARFVSHNPARELLRAELDAIRDAVKDSPPLTTLPATATREQLYFAAYMMLDRAQMCADPIERLNEVHQLVDRLIASYTTVKQ